MRRHRAISRAENARNVSRKLADLREGKAPQVSSRELWAGPVGAVPGPDVRAILALAEVFQREEDPDFVSISWDNQEKARLYFNSYGLAATLSRAGI